MANGDVAREYHRLTSYEPGREWTTPIDHPMVLQDFTPNDPDRWPPQVKAYPAGYPVTTLPSDWPADPVPATEVLAGRAAATKLDLPALARILYLSAGVVRTGTRAGNTFLFRAAGSAGARFPLEVYVCARDLPGLADGVHWYDPVAHALVQIGPAAGGDATTIVVTGVPWRTGWRYSERGYRHIYWDGGTLLAHQLALAGPDAALRTAFPDAQVSRLVGADGVHEFPIALLSLGPGTPAIAPAGPAATGTIDVTPLEFPLVTRTHQAALGSELGAPWPWGAPVAHEVPASAPLEDVILHRGSTRLMVRGAPLPRRTLEFSLSAARRGLVDHRPDPQFVAVHAVDGITPGVYEWPDFDHPVRTGDLRDEVYRVCLEQGLGGDASFVVMSMADLSVVGERDYREAQLGAGITAGRLHLAAFALGAGASGMTFLDSELEGLVGRRLDGMLFTCVGVPEYRNRRGGRPGQPSAVKSVMPRFGGQ
jgi:SagB-type dehydrogenase family enzyme